MEETFDHRSAPTPLFDAVTALCQDSGRTIEEMEKCTLPQIADLATETYGERLPEFWRIWLDWHRPAPPAPMGEL